MKSVKKRPHHTTDEVSRIIPKTFNSIGDGGSPLTYKGISYERCITTTITLLPIYLS